MILIKMFSRIISCQYQISLAMVFFTDISYPKLSLFCFIIVKCFKQRTESILETPSLFRGSTRFIRGNPALFREIPTDIVLR